MMPNSIPKYRTRLPQFSGRIFLTDSGLETELIFLDGIDLPSFASFPLLETERGLTRLRDYYQRFATTAKRGGFGLVLESPTWRANPDWAAKVGYSKPT
jgi:S-methylmethionine-dependent homocysteine/selenocysteine methylase